MIEINMYKRDSYLHQPEGVLDNETVEDCKNFMSRVIECRHNRVLERKKKRKFEALVQQKSNGCSNQDVWKNKEADNKEDKEWEERKEEVGD